MLAVGTVIEVQLPEHVESEAPIQATVLSCSSTMVSVRLQEIGSEVVHRVSLKKIPFRIVSQPGGQQQQANAAAADVHQGQALGAGVGPPKPTRGAEQQQQQQQGEQDGMRDGTAADAFPRSTAAAIEAFAAAVESDPAAFLQPTAELAALAKAAAKALYEYQATLEGTLKSSNGAAASDSGHAAVLPELYVDGFDAEQIWLQLELAVPPALQLARKLLKKAGQQPQLVTPEMEEAIDELLDEKEAGCGDDVEEQEGNSSEDLSEGEEGSTSAEEDEYSDALLATDPAHLDYDALLAAGAAQHRNRQPRAGFDSEEEAGQLAGIKRKRATGVRSAAVTSVEDEHFKLDEMEAFVQQAEREAAGLDDGGEDVERAAGSDDEEAQLEALLDQAAPSGHDKKSKKARKKAACVRQGPMLVSAGGNHRHQDELLGDEDDERTPEEEERSSLDDEGFEDDLLSDDMLSGEEEDGTEQGRHGRANGTPRQFSEDEDEDGWEAATDAGVQQNRLDGSEQEDDEDGAELAPSAHARRQQRMQEKIRKLEAAAMGEKDWFMQGEVDAGHRPKNSALEVDLDFETTVKPPPQPTEEMTRTLDELIKARIAEGRFDDVVRVAAAPLETKRTTVELDDKKPQQGLGELYEQEYMQAATGFADDKDDEVRQAARAQFSALCAKLDALSHLHFTPRPVIEEVTVKVDVPAIMMEEAAPQFLSGASMRAPEEVFATEASGAPRAEAELSREDRKQRRAQRKRAGKKRRASKEEERTARIAVQGGTTTGRKSEAAEQAARKLGKSVSKKRARGGSKKSEFSRSAAVFAKIEQHKEGATAAAAAQATARSQAPAAAHLKL
ncbi:hypothetical protein CHLNCDRAFT_142905 [Chlorella variabilis]|uniref:Uncharacterized protein n=1 Tax=Chlorella variabilis TaxID=554065 RepID=E1Z913_CHLVA|nr:hypothetical protein CHLNCDRAFT_142905 [Chlorella variabilis]EFN57436.1 hypothetical protein CHLNCDRAFT_142905 [Chlorella variabilis]|eukprot:XP_005849538.1 hypothetical protein CHLNCDRAFT_142905 [Chlorella variabilis]